MDLKKNIRAHGFTMEELARRLGISQQAVSQAVNGNPSLSRLQQFADAMQISLSELVADEPTSQADKPGGDVGQIKCPRCGEVITLYA